MIDTLPVTIGGLLLVGAEVPTFFDRTSDVRTSSVRVIGGDRVVQILGVEPKRRLISGYLVGNDAVVRAQAFEAMRDSGAPVVLTIGAWEELVLITSVTIRYADRGVVMQYALQAEALPPPLPSAVTTSAEAIGFVLADLAQSLLILRTGAGPNASFTAVGAALSQAQSAASSSFSSGDQISANLEYPATALMAMTSQYGAALTPSAGASQASGLFASASALTGVTNSALSLATVTRSGAFVNRAALTLAGLNGQSYQPIFHS